MDVTDHGLVLRELADGLTEDDIRAATGPAFTVDLSWLSSDGAQPRPTP